MVIQAEGVIAELTFHPVMILSSCTVTKSLRLDVSQCVLKCSVLSWSSLGTSSHNTSLLVEKVVNSSVGFR